MKARRTHAARGELANAIRSRYRDASGKAKRRILDEFIAASGYHEKSAIRLLNELEIHIRYSQRGEWIDVGLMPRKLVA
jgi:hypothetical protein